MVSEQLTEHDAFRLVLQIREKGGIMETDVATDNFISFEPYHDTIQ